MSGQTEPNSSTNLCTLLAVVVGWWQKQPLSCQGKMILILGSCFTFNFLTYFSLSILWALLYGLNVTTIVPLRSFLEILCTLAEMCLLHYDDSNLITIRRMDWSVLYAVCVYYSTLHLEKSHSWKKEGLSGHLLANPFNSYPSTFNWSISDNWWFSPKFFFG